MQKKVYVRFVRRVNTSSHPDGTEFLVGVTLPAALLPREGEAVVFPTNKKVVVRGRVKDVTWTYEFFSEMAVVQGDLVTHVEVLVET